MDLRKGQKKGDISNKIDRNENSQSSFIILIVRKTPCFYFYHSHIVIWQSTSPLVGDHYKGK